MATELRIAPEAGEPIGGSTGPGAAPLLMTREELARELRTSPKTITRMDGAGRLPRPVKVGHGKRWARGTIVAWIGAGCPRRAEWEAFFEHRGRGR